MLQTTYRLLQESWYSGWVGNALIESFCIHARALIEFFDSNTSESDEQVCARHFTDGSYSPYANGKIGGTLRGKLHAQFAHLSYQRTEDDSDKVGVKERGELLQLLNKEIENFASHLRVPYKEHWPAELRSKEAVAVPSLGQQNATAIITGVVQPYTMTPVSIVTLYRDIPKTEE
jgi:hypothetical protein